MATKEERAKLVLMNARTKIQKSEEEKKKHDVELEQIGQAQTAGASEEQDLRVNAIMSQLKSVKDDKERMKGERFQMQQEQERLLEQVDSLQTELQAAQLVSLTGGERPKPGAMAGVVQQQERQKPQQPRK